DKTYRNCQIIEELFKSGGWQSIADLIDLEGIIKYKGEFHFVESLKQDTNVGLQEPELSSCV
ncbi:sfmM2, partial [Symbiodinium pilosum]